MLKNTPKQIRERRDKILHLLAHGYSQTDIMSELGVTTMTYNRDMKNINETSEKALYDLAKSPPLKVYSDSVNHYDRIIKECWKIYKDPATNPNDKLYALG